MAGHNSRLKQKVVKSQPPLSTTLLRKSSLNKEVRCVMNLKPKRITWNNERHWSAKPLAQCMWVYIVAWHYNYRKAASILSDASMEGEISCARMGHVKYVCSCMLYNGHAHRGHAIQLIVDSVSSCSKHRLAALVSSIWTTLDSILIPSCLHGMLNGQELVKVSCCSIGFLACFHAMSPECSCLEKIAF